MKKTAIFLFFLFSIHVRAGNFNLYFPHIIQAEGVKFTITQYDRGGATKFGITLMTYKDYCKSQLTFCDKNNDRILNAFDLSLTTLNDVKPIYQKNYWNRVKADLIKNQALAEALTDIVINCGFVQGKKHIKAIQRFIKVKPDGVLGIATITKLNNSNARQVYIFIFNYRIGYYTRLGVGDQKHFKEGWKNRVKNLKKTHEKLHYI